MTKRRSNKIQRMQQKKQNKLGRKYPFLITKTKYGKYINFINEIPQGWWKRFGISFCEEMKSEFDYVPFSERRFHISQVKEKFGEMRVYCSYPNEAIKNIITKYEQISSTICIYCGAMDSRMVAQGWMVPVCKGCYERKYKSSYEDGTDDEYLNNGKTSNYYGYRIYDNDNKEWKNVTVDISDTVEKLRNG